MKKSGNVRVIKNVKVGVEQPRVDLRAKRVRVAPRIPRRMVPVKISKDKGRWGRGKKRRVESPSARDRGRTKRRNIGIQKRDRRVAEVHFDA